MKLDLIAGGKSVIAARRRLAEALPSQAHDAVHHVLDWSARRLGLTLPAPKVSVVVPVYNVGPYLKACLDSISAQTYRNLEIVVVDDGSTDDSLAVARRCRRRDRRIAIVQQPNGGLSAARNTGIDRASGEFLCFVDSDDRIAPHAVSTSVGTLRETGSDFAVSSYRRMNSQRSWPAGPWIREAHAETRLRVRLEEYPAILVNAVAWSKTYRRSFWDAAGLRFEEGVLYEDQAVSAEAYAKAARFDVLSDVLYDWRVREDKSSISQQVATDTDLKERLGAAFASLTALRRHAGAEVVQERSRQLLVNDFRLSLAQIDTAGDDYWKILVDGLRQLFDVAAPEVWEDIPAQARAMYHFVLDEDWARAEKFLADDGLKIEAHPTRVEGGRIFSLLPFHDDPEAPLPQGWNELREAQTELRTAVRNAWWAEDGTLEIRGWAHIPHVDLAEHDSEIRLILRSSDGRAELPLEVGGWQHPDLVRVPGHQWCDYSTSGFAVSIEASALPRTRPGKARTWFLHARVEVAGVVREGDVGGVNTWGSAGQLPTRDFADGGRVGRKADDQGRFCLRASSPVVTVVGARRGIDRVTLELRTRDGRRLESVSARRGRAVVSGAVVTSPDGRATVSLALPKGTARPRYWTLRGRDGSGKQHALAWTGATLDGPADSSKGSVQLRRTVAGNVTVIQGGSVVDVQSFEVRDDELLIRGSCSPVPRLEVGWSGTAGETHGSVEFTGETFVARLPLLVDPWGLGKAPLAVGRYGVFVRVVEDEDRAWPVGLELGDHAIAQLPHPVATDRFRARLERSPEGRITLIVSAPLSVDEIGARNQRRLKDWHRTETFEPRPDAVLFRSFYGENTSCNGLAVHRELRRRGTDLSLYWVVKDHSVPVPEGGIPVLANSRRHYELLGSARYVFDNVHQPDFATKRSEQVFVQTFHGYPFKAMGRPYWQRAGYPRHRIASFDQRMEDWDYVVSPAGYATPLLREAFGLTGEVLEIGYPRNDVLVDSFAADARSRTRAALGIDPSQQVVLYAPTYRDNLSTSEFASRMVDFLDVDAFERAMGPDTVLLVRGHAMNARLESRKARRRSVIDVTDHPEISDLVLASDAAILDYSSLRFDYAVTDKPMIFLVPDLQLYGETARGWLFDYEPTAPGPLVSTTAEVVTALKDPAALARNHSAARARFRSGYMELEDGRAAARLVDAVMGPRGDA
jgi:CDP-glycerol glycerophosphotransferase